jgi:hypothetical protein
VGTKMDRQAKPISLIVWYWNHIGPYRVYLATCCQEMKVSGGFGSSRTREYGRHGGPPHLILFMKSTLNFMKFHEGFKVSR